MTAVGLGEQRVDQSVLGARGVGDLDGDLAAGAAQPPQQRARGAGAQLVAAVVGAKHHRVDQDQGAGRGPEGGFQHHRVVQVAAGHARLVGGPDGEMAGLLVQQAGEHRWAVEAGKHSQSTDPSRLTSAAEWQSDSSA
jgi:hypothetical protein